MLTVKQIIDNKELVIAGLEKKHFQDARETIEKVLEIDNRRKAAQNEKDTCLAEQNKLAKSIGMLMKQGQREEAEAAKQQVA